MNRFIKKLLLFTVFLSPLGANEFSFHTSIGSFSLFRIFLLLACFLEVVNDRGKMRISFEENTSKSIRFLWYLLLYALFSGIWSISYSDWIHNMFFIIIAFLSTVLLVYHFSSREDLLSLIVALNAGIVIQSLIGWYEAISGVYYFKDIASDIAYRYNVGGFNLPIAMQYNPNNFALLMCFGLGVAYICFVNSKVLKPLYGIIIVNYMLLIIISASRAAIIAMLFEFAFILFFSGRKKIVIVFIPIIMVVAFPEIIQRMLNTVVFDFGNASGSDVIRVNLIKNGFYFLGETFGFGVGAGQIQMWMAYRAKYDVGVITPIHNWWMEMLTSFGIVIFAAYLRFYTRLFVTWWKNSKILYDSRIRNTSLAICAVMFGFIIGGVGPSSVISMEWLWIFWSICILGQGISFNDVIGKE